MKDGESLLYIHMRDDTITHSNTSFTKHRIDCDVGLRSVTVHYSHEFDDNILTFKCVISSEALRSNEALKIVKSYLSGSNFEKELAAMLIKQRLLGTRGKP